MSLVLDASLTLSWYFEDERTEAAERCLSDVVGHGACVPALWRLEVGNALQMGVRRKRIDASFRDDALARLARLPITVDPDTNTHAWGTTLRLADSFALTLYDAAYLELAQRRGIPLATLDQKLRDAAGAVKVQLFGVVT